QRGLVGGSVGVLNGAIEASGLRETVADRARWPADGASFDEIHRRAAREMVRYMDRSGLPVATYGRAAKLMAIYLKSMVVNGPDGDSTFAAIIPPPLDRILLENLARCAEHPRATCRIWQQIKWTALDE